MTTKTFTNLVSFILIGILFVGCSDQQSDVNTDQIDMDQLKMILAQRSEMMSAQTSDNAAQMTKSLDQKPIKQPIGFLSDATTDSDCFSVEFIENEDGSTTVIYDFGEECVVEYDFGEGIVTYIYSGKYTHTTWYSSSFTDTIFRSTSTNEFLYDEYGYEFEGNIQRIDGTSTSVDEFVDRYDSTGSSYELRISGEDDLGLFFENDSSTVEYEYTSEFTQVIFENDMGERVIEIPSAEYDFQFADGLNYQLTVIEPLIFSFSCLDVETETLSFYPVSGVEEVTINGITMSIDYGNGECDALVTITMSDGSQVEMDLSEE